MTHLAILSQPVKLIGVKVLTVATGLPRSTVSRLVISWLELGALCEVRDPDDRRRNYVRFTSESRDRHLKWAAKM